MQYSVQFKPRAMKDLAALSQENRRRILAKIEGLQDNLAGDVKRLTNFTPEYRLRVGDYRILFEINNSMIIIYRVKHRRNAYS
ncbi:MAG: type II toxin-antitoxin system RelE/ParE family toxin [Cyanothece sp. SIO2G6]|nr:type II toxin-antitoxin system RelE/ParE family toxin [Cyanothece sp. SIO2G6]